MAWSSVATNPRVAYPMIVPDRPPRRMPSAEEPDEPTRAPCDAGATAIGWIRSVAPEAATGRLARLYREAVERAGKVYRVLRIQSLRPQTLEASTALYSEIMLSPRSPLSRIRREMIATAVSRANDCHY